MKKKSTKIWIFLLVFPIPSLVLTAIMQAVLHASISSSAGAGVDVTPSLLSLIVNIFAMVVGVAAVISLLLLPLWIVMLIRADKFNKSLAQADTVAAQPTDSGAANSPKPLESKE